MSSSPDRKRTKRSNPFDEMNAQEIGQNLHSLCQVMLTQPMIESLLIQNGKLARRIFGIRYYQMSYQLSVVDLTDEISPRNVFIKLCDLVKLKYEYEY